MTLDRGSIVLTLFLTTFAMPALADDEASLSQLGLAQLARGDLAAAQTTLERSVAVDDSVAAAPRDLVRRVFMLNVLAALRHARGEDEAAERLLRRAVHVGAALPPEGDAEVAETFTGLARLAGDRGDIRAGLSFASKALARYERVSGPRRAERVEALVARAALMEARGALADAESALRTARRVAELEEASPALRSIASTQLGLLRLRQGRYAEAESLLEDSLAWAAEAMGPHHPALLSSMEALAECYRLRGRIDDASVLHERALGVAQRAFGGESPAAASIAARLAALRDVVVAGRRQAPPAAGRGGSAR